MKNDQVIDVFWFRRDLRLNDNKGLYRALQGGRQVLPLFILDRDILDHLPRNDHRVSFIYRALRDIETSLRARTKGLMIKRGSPAEVFQQLLDSYSIGAVYSNLDHEPSGIERDRQVERFLRSKGVDFHQELDHLVMNKNDVLKGDETPYHVYTPYGKRWKTLLTGDHLKRYPSETLLARFVPATNNPIPRLHDIGFSSSSITAPPPDINKQLITQYHLNRDVPAKEGTTRLGVHLRFGTVSIRQLVKKAMEWNQTFLNELIWREFYAMILWHHPYVVNNSFKPVYDRIEWQNNEEDFQLWKEGRTGYPMVDAGMRQLKESGYMHNRLRMITASFLSKHLLIDWRWGAAWFAEKLFDYELSSNNGGWQWSAGTGCDAAPYFRIFNPLSQQQKFDPDARFIRQWVTGFDTPEYPQPMTDHAYARERCLKVYRKALNS